MLVEKRFGVGGKKESFYVHKMRFGELGFVQS